MQGGWGEVDGEAGEGDVCYGYGGPAARSWCYEFVAFNQGDEASPGGGGGLELGGGVGNLISLMVFPFLSLIEDGLWKKLVH